ncbi:MAG: hypothetical protein SCJ93_08570 [Bacillota bacterium]|nr:hypothetical protein [Bacillota bacterium]
MIDFKEYVAYLEEKFDIDIENFNSVFMKFLVDNEWFGIEPTWKDDVLMIEPRDFEPYNRRINDFIDNYILETDDKNSILLSMLKSKLPDTAEKLELFYQEFYVPNEIIYHLTDFLLKHLKKDVCIMKDDDVQELLAIAYDELSKQYSDILCSFLRWFKDGFKTKYLNDYYMSKRQDRSDSNSAYDSDEYLEILYCLFNEEYILENDMYVNAAQSKDYVDTWLFLALHFICALRNSDIVRICHPRLTMRPEEVLEKIINGDFPDEDARLTLYSITWRLTALPLNPNKTMNNSSISSIKLCVPESVEVHIGTLLAIAESHRKINNIPDNEPLIRVISDYDRISRYMGDEIGALFLESNFRSRSANKSYLQSVFNLTEDILENDDEFNTKGYFLTALARSHKGSYGHFSTTTSIYLKDAKLNGFTPEFVAKELFERGVLSFIPSMLLKMITEGEYNKLSVHKQTELIKNLDLSPREVEDIVSISTKSRNQSIELINEILTDEKDVRNSILNILHRIGNGNAVSKQDECLCLLTAMKKFCPYQDRSSCIGCEYEISTKSTVFLIISEYNRLLTLYNKTSDERLKNKYKTLIKETVLPTIDELFQCVKEQYGDDALESLEKIVKEFSNV